MQIKTTMRYHFTPVRIVSRNQNAEIIGISHQCLASNEFFRKLYLPALLTICHIKSHFNLSLHPLTFCTVYECLVLHSYQGDYVEFQFFSFKSHFVTVESGYLLWKCLWPSAGSETVLTDLSKWKRDYFKTLCFLSHLWQKIVSFIHSRSLKNFSSWQRSVKIKSDIISCLEVHSGK
jgi:hypothetical protein